MYPCYLHTLPCWYWVCVQKKWGNTSSIAIFPIMSGLVSVNCIESQLLRSPIHKYEASDSVLTKYTWRMQTSVHKNLSTFCFLFAVTISTTKYYWTNVILNACFHFFWIDIAREKLLRRNKFIFIYETKDSLYVFYARAFFSQAARETNIYSWSFKIK